MIEIKFISWDLLISQCMPCLTAFALIAIPTIITKMFTNNITHSDEKYSFPTATQSVVLSYSADQYRPPSNPHRKDMTADIEKALSERTQQHITCPYCGSGNLTTALNCEKCGGAL